VTIPDSITSMGDSAFASCLSLTKVTIGNGVTSIGKLAFSDCTRLTSVSIGNSVASIGDWAFYRCASLATVTIPDGVTIIGYHAFYSTLKGVYFKGNAPSGDASAFEDGTSATIYYLPGTTGWVPTFGGRPTQLWNPQIEASETSFGVQTNRFGFDITWASGRVVVVDACTDLAQPIWSPAGTNTLTDGSSYFSDPQWTNYPGRFYRLRSP